MSFDAESMGADFFSVDSEPAVAAAPAPSGFDDPFGAPVESSYQAPSGGLGLDDFGTPAANTSFESAPSSTFDSPSVFAVTEQVVVQEVPAASISLSQDNPIARWQNEHTQRLASQASQAAVKREAILKKAQEDIDAFIQKRNDAKQKAHKANRDREAQRAEQRAAPTREGEEWSRVTELVDFKAKGGDRDTSRMKSILLALKH